MTNHSLYYINTAQLEHLAKRVSEGYEPIIYFDFDGIFSQNTIYANNGKSLKTIQHSVRYAIDMLKHFGFQVNIITGDSSELGRSITESMLKNIHYDNLYFVDGKDKYFFIKSKHEDISRIFYAGDDLFDTAMHEFILLTSVNAFEPIRHNATYISLHSVNDYLLLDFANAIITVTANRHIANRYFNKVRFSIEKDIELRQNNCVVLTESSTKLVDYYALVYNMHYNINLNSLVSAQSIMSFAHKNNINKNDIIIATNSTEYFKHISATEHKTYMLLGDSLMSFDDLCFLAEDINQKLAKAHIDKLCLLVKHIDAVVLRKFVEYCQGMRLYKILAIIDYTYSKVENADSTSNIVDTNTSGDSDLSSSYLSSSDSSRSESSNPSGTTYTETTKTEYEPNLIIIGKNFERT